MFPSELAVPSRLILTWLIRLVRLPLLHRLTVTYYVGSGLTGVLNAEYYVFALIAPTISVSRAGWVSINLFSLLCNGRGGYSTEGISSMSHLGAPIVYSIGWGLVCFGLLLWHDSGAYRPGSLWAHWRKKGAYDDEQKGYAIGEGVTDEAARVDSDSNDDALKVRHISKSYGSLLAVDDVSFGVAHDETFALCGVNGGGKTTTHGCIRGELRPDVGNITLAGVDVSEHRTLARSKLSSVPQHDGLDPTLTVREHLAIYARIKGIPRSERESNIVNCMALTNLGGYEHRQSSALSGGNQRKLSLAIAILSNPQVLLLDELSSGVDAFTKRGLWKTLKRVGRGRATLLTTHSMEEVDALASRVAIQNSRLLALGTIASLRALRPAYELQLDCVNAEVPTLSSFSASTNPHVAPAPARASPGGRPITTFVRSLFPHALLSDEASTRFEIPLIQPDGTPLSVSELFDRLDADEVGRREAGVRGYQVMPISLESMFLHIVREAGGKEQGH